ncbi:hypothetical protein [Polaribacter porphyrae]|uniref:Uncharacterized protein n=1 Tax=Polaribacter porphyrae TaxID=1137780 RepID=A0A2S7WT75_9FLAO|nr:hypothetical protein [Polaribacter porphyrae]PQJ80666.1 hypothetical protein BTO18_16455 [Polaribacter porphyrae]
MTIKERKLILHFLEMLKHQLDSRKITEINPVFLQLFSRKELIKIVLWLFTNYDRSMLTEKTDAELLELIGNDANVLSFVVEKWKSNIISVPTLTQEKVNKFFDELQLHIHYLRHKPVLEWDDYDVSNYYSILFKRGKTKRVFAIFTSDVKDEDKYAVSTQPSFFFDTKKEAEDELAKICNETKQSASDFVIHALWRIN